MKRSASPNGSNSKVANNVTPQKRAPVFSLLPPLSQPKSAVSSDFARIEKLYQGQNKKQKQSVSDSGPPKVLSGSNVRLQKDYFQKYETLIKYEIEDQMKDIEERHSKWPKSRLEREGISLFNLKAQMRGYLFHESLIVFKRMDGKDLPFHRFSHGDMVMVSCTGMTGADGKMGQLIDGVIAEKSKATITISTSTAFDNAVLENNIWRLDQAANRVSFDRMLASLRNFCSSDGYKCTAFKDFIVGNVKDPKQYATQNPPSWLSTLYAQSNWPKDFDSWKLNNCQRNVIRKALQNKITLIQGPPGTGKTHTAVHLVKLLVHCLKNTSKKVTLLCTADTNVAVDNLLEGLADQGIKALRVGKPVKIREELRDLSLDAKLLAHSENGQLSLLRYQRDELIRKGLTSGLAVIKQNIKSIESRMSKEVMEEVDVICSTCIGAAAELLEEYTFPVVLIDECTQATEPAAMCAIVKGAQHLVLLGDHFQLPPTVTSARAQSGGLAMSIFERFVNLGIESNLLQIQYRMHPTISEFPSKEFYNGKIADGIRGEDRPAPSGFDWPDKSKPVAFVSVKGTECVSADGVSKFNVEEADYVMKLVNGFLDEKMSTRDIGVITPYTGQVTYLKSMFDSKGGIAKGQKYHKLTIHSVDGFQGREKEIILFSTVRSNDDGNIGFLKDWRRLNVALTRARRGIIVIGSKDTLAKDARWSKWLSWVEKNNLEKIDNPISLESEQEKESEEEPPSHNSE